MFDERRKAKDPREQKGVPSFTTDQLQRHAQAYYESELADDSIARMMGIDPHYAMLRNRTGEIMRRDLGLTGNFVHVNDVADAIFAQEGFAVDRRCAAYLDLCQWLMRAKVEAFKRFAERDNGDFSGKPGDPILSEATDTAPNAPGPGESILELHERYLAERQGISAEWKITNKAIIRLFVDHVGSRTAPASITKKHMRSWKDALLKFPSRGTLRNPGATFQELIKINEKANKPTLSTRTVNKYLSAVGSFADWLVENEIIAENPVSGVYLRDDGGDDKRDPFTIGQLTVLFASPLFAGVIADDDRRLHLSGNVQIADHRYWLPLLALWSGARLGELAQLGTEDLQQLGGIDCLNINAIGANRLKSKAAKRLVPIHSRLKQLGFMQYVDARRASRCDRLFDIEPDSLGRISSRFSKWFSKYLRRVGIKSDARVSFHSFRHGFADQMRLAGYGDSDIAVIIGHSSQSTTARYGALAQFGPKERAGIIESVAYQGLDLTHLSNGVQRIGNSLNQKSSRET
jgi:integrase